MKSVRKQHRAWTPWVVPVLVLTMMALLFVGCGESGSDKEGEAAQDTTAAVAQLWTCGMHPDVITEEPGQCPICGMNLVPVKQESVMEGEMQHDDQQEHGEHAQLWTCSMHPDVLKEEPGECPICGMDLVPVKAEPEEEMDMEGGKTMDKDMDMQMETGGSGSDISEAQQVPEGERKILYWRAPMDPTFIRDKPGKSPMGMDLVPVYEGDESLKGGASVVIDPVTVQNIGIQTAVAERRSLSRIIRTVGHVDYDEKTLSRVNIKFSGWIERLYVDETGQKVSKGQKMLEIYSPELVSTQQEYLLAVRNERGTGNSSFADISGGGSALVEASRRRLEYWDLTEAQIEHLEKTGEVQKTVPLYSPVGGIVISKMAEEGMRVMPGMDLFRVADLSTIWVYAHLYDEDAQWVHKGQDVSIELPYMPGTVLHGRVDFIYPYLDQKSRDTKVRIVLRNPGLELRPNMYATIELRSMLDAPVITVPNDAVLRSGTRNVVFVDRGKGKFEPRNVVLGIQGQDGLVQVRAGVEVGERVVTSAQFLLDSESRLKEAIQKMLRERSGNSSVAQGI